MISIRKLAGRSLTVVIALGCTTVSAVGQATAPRPLPPPIVSYLDAALDTLRRVSRHAGSVDWAALRDSAHLLARGAAQTRDVYPVVDWLLSRVDRHSFLQASRFGARDAALGQRVAYIRVPSWSSPEMTSRLADTLQTMLHRQVGAGACRWIVDLRLNGGGNMWPMLAGIGPLLGDSLVGGDTSRSGRSHWKYTDGAATLVHPDGREERLLAVAVPPVRLSTPAPPVAVLVDDGTGSSGEVIAVAFRGRSHTRFFGVPTAGVSTTNAGFRLPDGANMVITTGTYIDRLGRPYGEPVPVDEHVKSPLHGPSMLRGDPVVAAALAWLAVQPCGGQ